MTPPPVIRLRDLTHHYGRTVGVDGLDLDVHAGEVFGFLGPNGAGKTTTIRLLLDLIRPGRGSAELFGRPVRESAGRSRLGYLPGELVLDGRMRGTETLRFLERLGDAAGSRVGLADRRDAGHGAVDTTHPPAIERRRAELCERLGMGPRDLRRRVREYSRGMKQKLGLVAAFQHDPELLVLDEPTTGLDPLVREVVFELLAEAKRRGRTVFLSSHVLSEVERTCDRVGMLKAGRLVALLRVEDARRATVRRMVVDFEEPVAPESLSVSGIEVVESHGRRMVLRVRGTPDRLLRVLAEHPVRHLAFPEPTLEDAFASYYRDDDGDPSAPPTPAS